MSEESNRDIEACPECESATIRVRGPRGRSRRASNPDNDYYCMDCGHYFDDPITRSARSSVTDRAPEPGTRGLGASLAKADPDTDWSDIVDSEPASGDGGGG